MLHHHPPTPKHHLSPRYLLLLRHRLIHNPYLPQTTAVHFLDDVVSIVSSTWEHEIDIHVFAVVEIASCCSRLKTGRWHW